MSFKHKLADMLHGKTDAKEIKLEIGKDDFIRAIKDIVDGKPIFPTPEIQPLPSEESLSINSNVLTE